MESTSARAAPEGHEPQPAPEWVIFGCADRRFAFPLERVREILLPRPFTRLPGCGPQVCGLVGLRGRVVTVFDLGAALGERPAAPREGHRLLLLETGDRVVAGAVDEVVAVTRAGVMPHLLPARGSAAPAIDASSTIGIGVLNESEFLALDPDRILGRLLA